VTDSATLSKVDEVWDRATAALPEPLHGVWSCADDRYDSYGDLMMHWFALNDAASAAGFPTHHSYRCPCGPDLSEHPADEYHDLMVNGLVTPEQIEQAHVVLDTLHHALELLGVSY
jgi:hypothetical protein